ncbi:MAG: DUF4917 family protein [Pseudomonadota bacterium]
MGASTLIKVLKFDEAFYSGTSSMPRHILLGNGFSIKYFSYPSLLKASKISGESSIGKLFDLLEITDFEIVIKALEDASVVDRAFQDSSDSKYQSSARQVRSYLIDAITKCHPQSHSSLGIQYADKFLSKFDKIFTVNYDIFLYWISLHGDRRFTDGFGKGLKINGFRRPFQKDAHCCTYFCHGGLHLFETEDRELEKIERINGKSLLQRISETIENEHRYPVYVAEGSTEKKLSKIRSVPYLSHCLDELSRLEGELYIFGHSADTNDRHIYQAIFSSNVRKIYISVFRKTANERRELFSNMEAHKIREGSEAKIFLFDAESANVWGHVEE